MSIQKMGEEFQFNHLSYKTSESQFCHLQNGKIQGSTLQRKVSVHGCKILYGFDSFPASFPFLFYILFYFM